MYNVPWVASSHVQGKQPWISRDYARRVLRFLFSLKPDMSFFKILMNEGVFWPDICFDPHRPTVVFCKHCLNLPLPSHRGYDYDLTGITGTTGITPRDFRWWPYHDPHGWFMGWWLRHSKALGEVAVVQILPMLVPRVHGEEERKISKCRNMNIIWCSIISFGMYAFMY